jgi:AbrB family looped-hinge helix DNA binding protein
MLTTIDKAGRVVIPAEVRHRLGLGAGTPLEVEVDDLSVRLVRAISGPEVVRRGKRRIARPTVPEGRRPPVDLPALIEKERDRWPG